MDPRIKLSLAIREFAVDLLAFGNSRTTVNVCTSDLLSLAAMAEQDSVEAVTPMLIKKYFRRCSEDSRHAPTLHRKAIVLREFFHWGVGVDIWPFYSGLPNAIPLFTGPRSDDLPDDLWDPHGACQDD